jgi:hypothetical protein
VENTAPLKISVIGIPHHKTICGKHGTNTSMILRTRNVTHFWSGNMITIIPPPPSTVAVVILILLIACAILMSGLYYFKPLHGGAIPMVMMWLVVIAFGVVVISLPCTSYQMIQWGETVTQYQCQKLIAKGW